MQQHRWILEAHCVKEGRPKWIPVGWFHFCSRLRKIIYGPRKLAYRGGFWWEEGMRESARVTEMFSTYIGCCFHRCVNSGQNYQLKLLRSVHFIVRKFHLNKSDLKCQLRITHKLSYKHLLSLYSLWCCESPFTRDCMKVTPWKKRMLPAVDPEALPGLNRSPHTWNNACFFKQPHTKRHRKV